VGFLFFFWQCKTGLVKKKRKKRKQKSKEMPTHEAWLEETAELFFEALGADGGGESGSAAAAAAALPVMTSIQSNPMVTKINK
jgi:hypothetical protein